MWERTRHSAAYTEFKIKSHADFNSMITPITAFVFECISKWIEIYWDCQCIEYECVRKIHGFIWRMGFYRRIWIKTTLKYLLGFWRESSHGVTCSLNIHQINDDSPTDFSLTKWLKCGLVRNQLVQCRYVEMDRHWLDSGKEVGNKLNFIDLCYTSRRSMPRKSEKKNVRIDFPMWLCYFLNGLTHETVHQRQWHRYTTTRSKKTHFEPIKISQVNAQFVYKSRKCRSNE